MKTEATKTERALQRALVEFARADNFPPSDVGEACGAVASYLIMKNWADAARCGRELFEAVNRERWSGRGSTERLFDAYGLWARTIAEASRALGATGAVTLGAYGQQIGSASDRTRSEIATAIADAAEMPGADENIEFGNLTQWNVMRTHLRDLKRYRDVIAEEVWSNDAPPDQQRVTAEELHDAVIAELCDGPVRTSEIIDRLSHMVNSASDPTADAIKNAIWCLAEARTVEWNPDGRIALTAGANAQR